jgi:hypothetical protein
MSTRTLLLALGALGALGAALAGPGIVSPGAASPGVQLAAGAAVRRVPGSPARIGGLRLRLSEGGPVEPGAPSARATIVPLDESEIEALLERLPSSDEPFATSEEDGGAEFAFPEATLTPPQPGEEVRTPFPPPAEPAPPEPPATGPLAVVRHAPDGDVPLAPHLSVTFSQPMVAVTTQRAAAETVPVKLKPAVTGRWRWVGTRTLLFEPETRFPMATAFEASVPAGTVSVVGGTLPAAVSWSFRTAPPRVVEFVPRDGVQPLEPLLFAVFDQRIEPAAVLGAIELRANGRSLPLRLATAEEVAAGPELRRLAEAAPEGRWLAFRPGRPLPPDSDVTVTVGPGVPSAEGPRRSERDQSYAFRTFGSFAVASAQCGWGAGCAPFTPWRLEFTNPIDEARFDPALVSIDPEVPGARVEADGTELRIVAPAKGHTSYTVKVDARLQDRFGQKLGEAARQTFAVGAAPPLVDVPGAPFVTLDPAGPPALSVFTLDHPAIAVEVYAVDPQRDWPLFARGLSGDEDRRPRPPGRRVLATTIETKGQPDTLAETRIDLSAALEDGHGHAVVVVSPPRDLVARLWSGRRDGTRVWVQATRLGLTATADARELLAWTTDLTTGAPVPAVRLTLVPGDAAATSDADGLARLPLWDRNPDPDVPPILVARRGLDSALLPERVSSWGGASGWIRSAPGDVLRWYVVDDRQLYRPGEEVRLKGWLRREEQFPAGDLEALGGVVRGVAWRVEDAQGNEVAAGDVGVNALGGFDVAVPLPPSMNLGTAVVHLTAAAPDALGGRAHDHTIEVQAFRRPEFEVTARPSEGPHVVGGHATVSVAASYYAGGALPDAPVTWEVATRPARYTPPGRGDFVFGTWIPWWEPAPGTRPEPERVRTFSGRTDAGGEQHLRVDFTALDEPRPTHVSASATVMDVNRQAWTASAALLVHPASEYVGLRADRTFVEAGQPLRLETVVTDIGGALVAGREVAVEALRREWKRKDGAWREEDAERLTCAAVSTAQGPAACELTPKRGGTWQVRASMVDAEGRANRSTLTLWVTGGKRPPRRELDREQVQLVPDRERYRPGDEAHVLVVAPFHPAEGVVTLRRSGVVSAERFTLDGPTHVLRVPIDGEHVPNVHVHVELVGAAARLGPDGKKRKGAPPRPAYAGGAVSLAVPPLDRTLQLVVRPRARRLSPGGSTTIDVALRDAGGRPVVGGEVAVAVVDEAVLALSGYRWPDPLEVFYPPRPAGADDAHLRASVVLAELVDPTAALARGAALDGSLVRGALAPGAKLADRGPVTEGAAPAAPPVPLREDFRALAVFAPAVQTGPDGRAAVPVELPDSLTRYRVMAVAVGGGRRFGAAESAITARLPLMVRPSAPRFLNFGDRCELPVVVQNQTDAPLPVSVALRASNLSVEAPQAQLVTVPPDDRVELRFPVSTKRAGRARFEVLATAAGLSDAAAVSLPVRRPATKEAFATYGVLDVADAALQPVRVPADARPEVGGLSVTTSVTALQALTDALLYLSQYPFECTEQTASRVLATVALKDVLGAFAVEELPPPEQLQAAMAADVARLVELQNEDGGFGFWRRGEGSWPWVSIHAAHALARARQKGFEVPEEGLARSREYLRGIEGHVPARYGAAARQTLVAYALHVRRLMDDADHAAAQRLARDVGPAALPLEAVGFLLPVLAAAPGMTADVEALVAALGDRVTETAAGAHFVTGYEDDGWLLLHSDRRADGILLEALVEVQPTSDLLPKLVEGLLGHRTAGRWRNTQENAFVLLGLDRYFAEFESQPPEAVARIWLGERLAAEHTFVGRTTDHQHVDIPMSVIAAGDRAPDLLIAREGTGPVYFRVGLRYAREDLTLAPADHGFTVERAYQAVDDPEDVRRAEDGAWHLRAGARVRVRLTMVAPARRHHVALVDPLPAGLEPLNPALATTGPLPADPTDGERGGWWWWTRTWYEHQNLRDERVEAFASQLWEGVHTYSYLARATTPGTFVTPPPRAEEMYHPETFGRGATDRVVVE